MNEFVQKIEAEAKAELNEEVARLAKAKIKTSLKQIAAAERVLQNLREDHAVLLRDIGV
jgi:hypothetical protein